MNQLNITIMKTGIIYEWRNKLDGKFYVGQTIRPKARYNAHVKAQGDSVFHRAIRLHGIENFEYTVVATYKHESSEGLFDLLNEAEKERIKFRNSLAPNGYNVADGGKNGNPFAGVSKEKREEWGRKISEKTSKRMKGENNPMKNHDVVKKVSDILKQHYIDNPELCVLLSEKIKQYYIDNPELCDEISENMKGDKNPMKNPDVAKKQSDSLKQHYIDNPDEMSERMKQYYIDNPEKRDEISERMKQYFIEHPEACDEISERMKQYYIDNPEKRDEMSKRMKELGDNHPSKRPEVRAKISKGMKEQIPVNNGVKCIRISKETLDEFLENNPGWVRGYINGKGKIPVNNGVKCIQIPKETLDEFLENNPGWVYGLIKRKKSA